MKQPQQPETVPPRQQLQFLEWLAQFPALTVMVILRRDIGYRFLSPIGLTATAVVMFAVASFTQTENRPEDLKVFAGLVLALGFFQRYLRWMEYRRGEAQHSYYLGTSCFQFPFLQGFFLRERRIARFVDPIFCLAVGFALLNVSAILGGWIMVSALCLRLVEFAVYRREFGERMNIGDDLTKANIQGRIAEHFTQPSQNRPGAGAPATGIPTGLGDDIKKRGKSSDQRPAQPKPGKPKVEIGLWNLMTAKPKLTRGNIILAFFIAIIADSLYFVVHYLLGWFSSSTIGSMLMPGTDSISQTAEFAINCVAMTATMLLLGFHWALIPSIFVPFLPTQYRIPTWTGCVAFVVWQRRKDSSVVEPQVEHEPEPMAEAMPKDPLLRLKEYHRQGLMSDEEFEERRRKILDEL